MKFDIKIEVGVDYIGISSLEFYINFDVNPVHTSLDFYCIEIYLNCIW